MRNNIGLNQREYWPLATHRGRLAPQKRPKQVAICNKLIQEKKEADKKKLFAAYSKSKRSLDEVLDFLKGKADI